MRAKSREKSRAERREDKKILEKRSRGDHREEESRK
jgi:hypothetical protein